MIETRIKTIFQGKVGIREQFVNEALRRGEGLIIKHKQETMVIPANKLKALVAGKSDKRFPDYYGKRKPEYLIYFFFRPGTKQEALL